MPVREFEDPPGTGKTSSHAVCPFNNTRLICLIVSTAFILLHSTITSTSGLLCLAICNHDNSTQTKNLRISSNDDEDNRGGTDSADSVDADLAFFIQVSSATVHLLPRLLRVLYHPKNVYVVHFDLKIPPDIRKTAEENILDNDNNKDHDNRNIHIMPTEVVTYRGITTVLNTINAMIFLFRNKHLHWDYFINLSGSDYPLVTPQTARTLLGRWKGGDGGARKKDLNYFTFDENTGYDFGLHRVSKFYYDESLSFRQNGTIHELKKLPFVNPLWNNRQFVLVKAEPWMIVSRDFCDFVIHDGTARKLLLSLAYSDTSIEHYFVSIVWNHEQLNQTIVPDALREIIWTYEGRHSGQHPYNIDELNDQGEYKFLETLTSSSAFFARKFTKADSKLMDLLDKRAWLNSTIRRSSLHIAKIVREVGNPSFQTF